jgi:hypothetical protein
MLQSPQNCKHCEQRHHHGAGSTDPVRIQKANVLPFIPEKRYPWVRLFARYSCRYQAET